MAGKLVTGLAAGAGSFIGLVIGAGIAQVVSKKSDTYETRTATQVLGAATGMVGGAFVAAAIAAEPEPAASGTPGTAGIPKGLGAETKRPAVRGASINAQLMPARA